MKVLHVLNELRPSGAEVMLRCSGPFWHEAGVEPEILSTGQQVGSFAPQLMEAGYPVHHLPFSKTPWFFWRFYRFLRNGKYHVVHVHSDRGSFYYALLVRLARKRFIRTIHGIFRLKGLVALGRSLQRNITRWIGGVQVSVSRSVQDTERKYLKNKTILVENWYETSHYVPPTQQQRETARERLGIGYDPFVVLSVANCGKAKNHPVIFEALSSISISQDFVYLHVGEEEPGFPERELAEKLGIAEKVRFLGSIPDVLPFFHAADLFVMPSLWEGLSIAALEAMGAGVPVLFSNVPGLADLRDIEGTYWSQTSSDSLTTQIERIARLPPAERQSVGERVHHEVKKRFGVKRGVSAYGFLYGGRLSEIRAGTV